MGKGSDLGNGFPRSADRVGIWRLLQLCHQEAQVLLPMAAGAGTVPVMLFFIGVWNASHGVPEALP